MSLTIQSPSSALIALEKLIAPNTEASQAAGANQSTGDAPTGAAASLDLSGLSTGGPDPASGLEDAASLADAAVSAGGVVTDLLAQMRQAAIGASDPNLSASDRTSLNATFQSDLAQIDPTVAQASVGGVNLIDGSIQGSFQQPVDGGTTVTLAAADLSAGGAVIGLPAGADLSDPATSAAIAGQLQTAIAGVNQAVGQIAAQGQSIESHLDVMSQAQLASGVSGQVNGDLDADGARLQALQVQQQLLAGGYAVSDGSSQSILSLFR
jgi:flagellin